MWPLVPLLAALFALGGTLMQAHDNLSRLKELDPEGTRTFRTVDGFKTEHRPNKNPIRWLRTQLEVQQLLAESPLENDLYKRVRRQLWSWLLLAMAALMAVVIAVANFF